MLSTCRQFRKTKVVLFFSFKLNTGSYIRSIYYKYMYAKFLKKIFSRILINWEQKGK